MDAFRILVYLALATSIGLYGWRAYRHVVHHETRHDRAERRRAAEAGPDGDATPSTKVADPKTVGSSKERRRPEPQASPTKAVEDGSLVRDVIRQEMAKKQGGSALPLGPAGTDANADASTDGGGTDASGGRTGLFAKPQRPVAELLAGVALPCDLAPLVDRDELDPTRVVFATTGYAPAAVARALADELERLGFRVETVGASSAVARKADGDLHLTIHDELSAFPTAPRSGVVVELTS